jgi:hypothetical protein
VRRVDYGTRERFTPGHANEHVNLTVRYDRTAWELESQHGTRDDVHVYRTPDGQFYVLSVNHGMPYVGLALYDVDTFGKESPRACRGAEDYIALSPVGEVFLQVDHEIESALGPSGVDQSPARLIRLLAEYL